MEYYQILNFKKEPFSNSPEPAFLFQSPQHANCLQMLEMSVRLRRGLNVVIGDVGTGKTTLCRKLIQNFSFTAKDSPEIETHLLLDPALPSTQEFLQTVASLLGIKDYDSQHDEWHLKEKIKNYLFSKGVDEGKIIVLIIDEGQKIPEASVEVLREFLNYETNSQKLLQIIIFAQKEFKATLKKHHNLADRVNLLYYLKPLSFLQMRAMINYRIGMASEPEIAKPLFSFWGLALVYASTGGYPRKIVSLCHQVILMLIIHEQKKAGLLLVKNSIKAISKPLFIKTRWVQVSIAIIIVMGISVGAFFSQHLTADTSVKQVESIVSNIPVTVPNDNLPVDQRIEKTMPPYLGTVTANKGRSLWTISKYVYGDYGKEIINAVLEANPQIRDVNKLAAGELIKIPSIPSDIGSLKKGDLVIQIEEGNDMGNVYNIFKEYVDGQSMLKVVFLSFWNKKEEEVKFAVVINKCFSNMQDVENEIKKLPPALGAKAKILSQWDENTVFFNRKILLR